MCIGPAQSQQIGVDSFFVRDEEGATNPIISGVSMGFVTDEFSVCIVRLQVVERWGEVGMPERNILEGVM